MWEMKLLCACLMVLLLNVYSTEGEYPFLSFFEHNRRGPHVLLVSVTILVYSREITCLLWEGTNIVVICVLLCRETVMK